MKNMNYSISLFSNVIDKYASKCKHIVAHRIATIITNECYQSKSSVVRLESLVCIPLLEGFIVEKRNLLGIVCILIIDYVAFKMSCCMLNINGLI